MNYNDYDDYEVLYDFDEAEVKSDSYSEPLSIPDAFLACRRQLHVANIGYIAELAHTTKEEVALALQGTALFQNPEFFMRNAIEWNIDDGWEFREQYLSGFLPLKLRTAKIVNRRMSGKFDKEVRALEKLTDDSGMIQTMPVFSLGSPFVPEDIYAVFIQTLLRLRDKPRVVYNPLKARFHIGITNQDDLRQAKSNPLYNTTRMNAIEIITKTMNAATVKVYDERTDYYGKVVRIFNKAETYRAQEIQKKLIEVFKSYINSSTSRRKRVKDAYAKTFIGFHHISFDGSYLTFPDLNPQIHLFDHQKNAIAQALESEHNVLFAHRVGAGKTYVIIITAHELYRTGLSKKNLVVVPNQILQDFEQAHKLLYPDDKILVVTPKMFTPSHRAEILEDIRDGDYTAVYMAYSSFKMVPMSKQYKLSQMSKEIGEIRATAASAPNAYERHSLESMADKKAEKMREFAQEYSDPKWLCFDRLGVDTLFVDEAHNFKNISINSRSDGIVGFRSKGSKTSDEMLQKVHFVNRSVFSTGTPLTNSIADLYTLMTYLQPEQLKFRNIESFDMWINTFGERESDFELDVGHKLRPITRFSTFHNLTELMDMFSLVCNFHYEDGGEEIPKANYSNVTLQKTDEQEEYIKDLGERTELIRQHLVSRKEDNLLKITTDGRKCALDLCLTDPYQSGGGKIEACAEEIWQLYRHYDGKSQVVFSDIGTPKEGFNVYDELKENLAELGVPRDEIAFIHEAKTERQRARLFQAVNDGRIRVIIGSTEKLGVGVNIQKNLIAMHHLSIPWRPSDIEQREGRILRRGNSCEKVFIYRYITEGTFDGYSWQLLENKQKFIAGFLSGTSAVNSVRDISDTVLTYAEVKALAIGNKLIKKRVDTANRLEHMRITSRQRERQLAELKQMVDAFPDKIRHQKEHVDQIRLNYTYYTHHRTKVSREERQAFGEELIEALKQKSSEPRIFDTYNGFTVELPADMPQERPYIYLVGLMGERFYVEIDPQKPMGCSQRLDFTLDRLDERAEQQNAVLSQYRRQLKDARADIAAGNPYIEQIEALEQELERIDKELNESEAA